MSNYIHLIGSEEVGRAGNNMASAAESMQMAANQIDTSLELFIQRFEEAVARLEALNRVEESI